MPPTATTRDGLPAHSSGCGPGTGIISSTSNTDPVARGPSEAIASPAHGHHDAEATRPICNPSSVPTLAALTSDACGSGPAGPGDAIRAFDRLSGAKASPEARLYRPEARPAPSEICSGSRTVVDLAPAAAAPSLHPPSFADYSHVGIIDTISLWLRFPVDGDDEEGLAGHGLVLHMPKRHWTGQWKRIYVRSEDGLTVEVSDSHRPAGRAPGRPVPAQVVVRCSVPRVLSGCNRRVYEVTADEVARLVERMTRVMLPRTTADALGDGRSWAVLRVDLARDVETLLVEQLLVTYRLARTKRVRGGAHVVRDEVASQRMEVPVTLYWHARRSAGRMRSGAGRHRPLGYELVLYAKHLEMRHREIEGAYPCARVELRLCSARSRALLTKVMAECAPWEGLPFMSGGVVRWYRLDYARMHSFQHREVALLEEGAQAPRPSKRPTRRDVVGRREAVQRIAHFQGFRRFGRSDRHREALRREALWVALERIGTRLSWLGWPRHKAEDTGWPK